MTTAKEYITISVTGSDDEAREMIGKAIGETMASKGFTDVEVRHPDGTFMHQCDNRAPSVFDMIAQVRPSLLNAEVVVSTAAQPLQPYQMDAHGVKRYRSNEIVRNLVDSGKASLNHLAAIDWNLADKRQFWQQLGYSESGFGDLSFSPEGMQAEVEYIYEEMLEGLKETGNIKKVMEFRDRVEALAKEMAHAI